MWAWYDKPLLRFGLHSPTPRPYHGVPLGLSFLVSQHWSFRLSWLLGILLISCCPHRSLLLAFTALEPPEISNQNLNPTSQQWQTPYVGHGQIIISLLTFPFVSLLTACPSRSSWTLKAFLRRTSRFSWATTREVVGLMAASKSSEDCMRLARIPPEIKLPFVQNFESYFSCGPRAIELRSKVDLLKA